LQALAAIFSNPLRRGSRILFEGHVINGLHAHRQLHMHDPEAGSIFLGYRRPPHLHVVEFTSPSTMDERSRYSFFRCDPFHAQFAHKRWNATAGMMDFLGEWHTHPQSDPAPSALDLIEWRRILKTIPDSRVFLIVGQLTDWIGIGSGGRIHDCPRIS